MRVWTVEDVPEHFDDMLDAAEAHGPQIILHLGKPMILTTSQDLEAHDAGKRFAVDDYLLERAPSEV